mgnify:CR=1 FL=1
MSIKIENLTYVYMPKTPFEKKALDNVSLEIEDGEFLAVIGHTGSGKSTLIQHLNGLLKPARGKNYVDGTDITDKDTKLVDIRKKVGLVFQYPEYQLFEETIAKDIAYGPSNLGLNEDEILKRVKKSMEMVGLNYEEYKDISPFELSGGQKRRVAIAGVIAMEPKVLILDEPINGLDPMGIVEIRELLKKINKEKDMTILISSHILSELSELATTYGIISNGKLIEEITAKQLSEKCRQYIDLKVDDTARAVILLERELGISDYEVLEDSNIKVFSNLDNVGEINSLLSRSGIIVESISVKGENLEEYFMNKVGGVLNA